MLVGDIIQSIRTAIVDQPGVLPAPTGIVVTAGGVAGASVPIGTYRGVCTYRNPWGESAPSTEFTVTTAIGQQAIIVTPPSINLPPGVTYLRVYLTLAGGATGTEQQYVEFATQINISFYTIAAAPSSASVPPNRNSCYLPDSDGRSFSSTVVYQWLNDALKLASQICGGLIDYAGVSTVAGNPSYVVPGQWRSIPDIWYDGYPLAPDKTGNFFRRNAITASVLSQVTTSLFDNRMALEVWPQPARTASSTTLSAPMGSFDTSLSAVNLGGFLLTNGMVQVENEIMAYAGNSSGQLKNLLRGLGGTTAADHPQGALVSELNLFFHGWRVYSPNFQPGQSLLTIPVPVGWETILPMYGLGRAKLSEQNLADWNTLYKQFVGDMTTWFKTNHVTTGPKQVGDVSNSLEVIPSLGGGWVVP